MSSRCCLVVTSFGLLGASVFVGAVQAEEQARMAVTVIATGTDSTRSEGEWSKGTFSYQAEFTTTLTSDGEPGTANLYDPEYAQKAAAEAARTSKKIQDAMQGKFSDEEETEAEAKFLTFMGQIDCPSTFMAKVNEKVEGEYADVGGMQPYTQTFTANYIGDANDRNMICVGNNSVLDIKDNTLYRSTLGFPGVTGHYLFSEANRGNRQDEPNSQHKALPTIVSDYVFKTLQVNKPSGEHKATLTPTEPVLTRIGVYDNYQGKIDIEIRWQFDRQK